MEFSILDPIPDVNSVTKAAIARTNFLLALTGKTELPSYLTQETIEALNVNTETQLLAKYPCVGNNAENLSQAEYDQWLMAVGAYSAYEWIKYPANCNLVAPTIETVKIGPVTEKYSVEFQDPSYIRRVVLAQGRKALKSIACIAPSFETTVYTIESKRRQQTTDDIAIETNAFVAIDTGNF